MFFALQSAAIHLENGINLILALLGPVISVLFFDWCTRLQLRRNGRGSAAPDPRPK